MIRPLTLFFVLLLCRSLAVGQTVSYNIPAGYESSINQADYKRLADRAVRIVAKRYVVDKLEDGVIKLKEGQEMQALNLHNLIVKCADVSDKAGWDEIINAHFNNLFASIDEQKKIDPANFESIKKYLSIRIYPAETVRQRGGAGALVTKNDLEGTATLLMLDLPGAFTAVQRPMFAAWNKQTSEVFEIAQENVNKQRMETITQQFDIDGTSVEISFLENEDYAASFALDLIHNAPELVGEWGSVVAIPNKGLVNVCKVSKEKPLDFMKFIQRTRPLIETSYKDHAQPVSTDYFWYYNGTFTRIPVVTDADGKVMVFSPPGLTELMTEKE